MQKVLRYLFFVTVALGGVLVCSNQYSQELTTQFYTALGDDFFCKNRNLPLCMSMLDDPVVASKIDFNMPFGFRRDNALQHALWDAREDDLPMKIFNVKKNHDDFFAYLNYKNSGGRTILHYLSWTRQPYVRDMMEQILSLKDAQGNSIVNVDDVDNYGSTPLMSAHDENVDMLLKFKANINVKNKWGKTALCYSAETNSFVDAKKLLISGADVASKATVDYCGGPYFLDMLRSGDCDLKTKMMIFAIYDAVKPDLIKKELSFHEQDVVQAYDEFLDGKHDELRNLLLVLPDGMRRKHIPIDPFIEPIRIVFKRDSIKQLLLFLAEKKYQQNMAHYIIESFDLRKEPRKKEIRSDEKLGWQSSNLIKERCKIEAYSDEKPRTCTCCSLM